MGLRPIKHIWFGGGADEQNYLRKMLLRMYWDEEETPSVETPLGDFFGVGHGVTGNYVSLPLSMRTADRPDRAALSCFFPMPFATRARIEMVNECDGADFLAYFYIDYQSRDHLDASFGRFHAQWRRENPCQAVRFEEGKPEINLTGQENYVLLEAEGKGHYVGSVLSVHSLLKGWWGEGDDMIFIDGEQWPPSLHGTGTEDYFNSSYEFPLNCSGPYHGVSLAGSDKLRDWDRYEGKTNKWSVYRFHIEDAIAFERSIRVTIEHGHANDRSDDYSSVAYWYQSEPHKPFPKILPVSARLPRKEGQEIGNAK